MSLIACTLAAVLAADPTSVDRPVSALTAIRWAALSPEVIAAADKFVQAGDWRYRNAAGDNLAKLGDESVTAMVAVVQTTGNPRLQRDAFQWLRKHFPQHAQTKGFILTEGLSSANFSIRYESLWHVGEHRWTEAQDQLRGQLQDYNGGAWHRYVAAKSLAELGDARALGTLLEAVQQDRYMPRHFGNLGLAALTGKSLDDFGYEYGENAFVSGGVEARMLNPDPLETAEMLARRHTACRDYLKWLHDNRPELYEMLTTRF